jgi:hypothetical protein
VRIGAEGQAGLDLSGDDVGLPAALFISCFA